jgi:hypothetical protein
MDVRVATRPEKFGISIFVVPPGVGYIIEHQRREITIVLIQSKQNYKNYLLIINGVI